VPQKALQLRWIHPWHSDTGSDTYLHRIRWNSSQLQLPVQIAASEQYDNTAPQAERVSRAENNPLASR
jgi:hypothetical protein